MKKMLLPIILITGCFIRASDPYHYFNDPYFKRFAGPSHDSTHDFYDELRQKRFDGPSHDDIFRVLFLHTPFRLI